MWPDAVEYRDEAGVAGKEFNKGLMSSNLHFSMEDSSSSVARVLETNEDWERKTSREDNSVIQVMDAGGPDAGSGDKEELQVQRVIWQWNAQLMG